MSFSVCFYFFSVFFFQGQNSLNSWVLLADRVPRGGVTPQGDTAVFVLLLSAAVKHRAPNAMWQRSDPLSCRPSWKTQGLPAEGNVHANQVKVDQDVAIQNT